MTPQRYQSLRAAVIEAGYGRDIAWAQSVRVPESAEAFAGEAIWVILCSGMREQVARIIQGRVQGAIEAGRPVIEVFRHAGKAAAIDRIWRERAALFAEFQESDDKVEWCRSLPWIGDITKWHLAKNLGVDCAKPDVHLARVAEHYGTTPAALCAALAVASGDRVATVDYVIWRACNLGIIRSREKEG
jgi:hypothetical protein